MCGLEFEAELSNLSSCRRLAAVWNYGFSRSSQLVGFQRLKPLVHGGCGMAQPYRHRSYNLLA